MIKKYYKILFSICFLFFSGWMMAQCDISNFTITGSNGVCNQDMSVTVNVPNITSCTNTPTASIRLVGSTTDIDVVSITNTGSAIFNNLAAGTYEVYLKSGATTTPAKRITLTTTYIPINVTATANNTTCSTTDPQYSNNGTVTVQYSGGSGNYEITLTGPGGPYIYNASSAGTHTFSNLAPGNYLATVTDKSSTCSSSEARSATIAQTSWTPLKYSLTRRLISPQCRIQLRFDFTDGNRAIARIPGNATYTIAGDPTVYNLTPNNNNPTGVYSFNTAFGIPANTDVTYTVTDGCRTITDTVNSGDIEQPFYAQQLKQITDQNCQTVFSFIYRTWEKDIPTPKNVYYWNFSTGRTATYYAEVPAMSNNWELIESITTDANMSGVAGWTEYQTTHINTRIKIIFSDSNGCNTYEKIVDGRNVPNENNLNKVILNEVAGVLEGTSTISVDKNNNANWSGTDSFSYPITFNLKRKDGQTKMFVNASQPYNLAGSYEINFPYVKTYTTAPNDYWSTNRPMFGDLPLGEYVLEITDGCGYSITREINLTKPAGYDASISYNVGCAASDVIYDMGTNSDTHNLGRAYIYQNNNGTIGNVVRPFNPNQLLEGTFTNIQPGDYFLVYKNVNYYKKLSTTLPYDSPEYTNSVARGVSGADQEYHVAFTVAPYQQMDFSTVSLFCNPNDNNSGILAITAQGIPVGQITYSIWANGSNPSTDTPLQTYTTNNLSEMSHVFTGLSVGNYIVRVSNDCGFKEQQITLSQGLPTFPDPVSIPEKICIPGESTNLAIALPNSLFDIKWYDESNNLVGEGNNITVTPMATTTYTVKYSLLTSLGCSNTSVNEDTITIEVGNCFCYKPAQTVGTTLDTPHGITALSRAGSDSNDNWPMVRKGAWTVLESKTKGFVLNKIPTTAQVEAIANPIEGMTVYDEQEKCMKIYTTVDNGATYSWKCFNVQTCPQ